MDTVKVRVLKKVQGFGSQFEIGQIYKAKRKDSGFYLQSPGSTDFCCFAWYTEVEEVVPTTRYFKITANTNEHCFALGDIVTPADPDDTFSARSCNDMLMAIVDPSGNKADHPGNGGFVKMSDCVPFDESSEPEPEVTFEVGDVCQIVAQECGHGFDIGQTVKVVKAASPDSLGCVAESGRIGTTWWCVRAELNKLAPQPIEFSESDQELIGIEATLEERGNRYGEFDEHARITQNIKTAMVDSKNWEELEDDQKEALEMIAHKIGRILNGDPDYDDSWVDISGYASLIVNRLTLKVQSKEV